MIAGAIGGAGRLNFSVIGGVVNVAARVEEHTRETDDDILITGETWKRLSHQFEVESRGKVELRGVAEPVTLYAPKLAGQGGARAGAASRSARPTATARASRLRRLRRAPDPALTAPGAARAARVIRFLTWLGIACLVGGDRADRSSSDDNAPIAIVLVLVAFVISVAARDPPRLPQGPRRRRRRAHASSPATSSTRAWSRSASRRGSSTPSRPWCSSSRARTAPPHRFADRTRFATGQK